MRNTFSFLRPLFLLDAVSDAANAAADASDKAAAAGLPNDRADAKVAAADAKMAAMDVAANSPGVVGLLAMIDFVTADVGAVRAALADDGKITLTDIMKLAPIVPTVMPMVNSLSDIPAELKGFTADEFDVIIAEAAKAFPGLGNADLVLKIKDILALGEAAYKVFADFKK